MASSWLSYLRLPVLASSGLAAVASGLLYYKQNELIYPRNLPSGSRTEEGFFRPSRFGVADWEELRLPTPDGETLSAFYIRPANKSQAKNLTILMFHGNAGNIGHRVPIAGVLQDSNGCNVLMLEYRGYGLSTGIPNEDGLKIDAQTGLDYLRQRKDAQGTKIVVYGQSLGGAVSIDLVAKNQKAGDIAGLVLENTFTSIRKLIPSAFPPAKYLAPLCHQLWESEKTLPQIVDVPILFLSGLKDEIVPPSQMKELFKLCRSQIKVWKELPDGTHNDSVSQPHYFNFVYEFIKENVLKH
ncbi:Alpha/beta hydrolase domain-containing protein 13 [Agyrium rufum]|nr:Alpha/beta hydrolase domain-containing protein 13 [Agyrium rufum]